MLKFHRGGVTNQGKIAYIDFLVGGIGGKKSWETLLNQMSEPR